MRKSELMLGAIVSLRGDEAKRVEVNAITKKKIQYVNEKKQPEYFRYSQLVPIALSNRILEDLGFERVRANIGRKIDEFILILCDKKDENKFFKITIEPDDQVSVNGYRAVHIDDHMYMNAGFGYARDLHELQAIVQSTTKLCLNTEKILLCGKD